MGTDFIKNWLAQHIKNTDFTYKGLLPEIHPIPAPFKWNSFFAVFYQDMDEDHKVLFSCLADIEANPSDDGILASCLKSYQDHFKAKNWLTQHIPNTDFRYKNMMPFPVADPYVWDESFEVFRKRLDDEHVILFDYEEKQFMECGEPCDADAHKLNHDIFFKTLTWVTNPVSTEYMDWAMNWLAQHIKNTDFKYRYKLKTQHKTPEPYVWNKEFEVHYPRLDQEHVNLFEIMYQ